MKKVDIYISVYPDGTIGVSESEEGEYIVEKRSIDVESLASISKCTREEAEMLAEVKYPTKGVPFYKAGQNILARKPFIEGRMTLAGECRMLMRALKSSYNQPKNNGKSKRTAA